MKNGRPKEIGRIAKYGCRYFNTNCSQRIMKLLQFLDKVMYAMGKDLPPAVLSFTALTKERGSSLSAKLGFIRGHADDCGYILCICGTVGCWKLISNFMFIAKKGFPFIVKHARPNTRWI